MTFYNNLRVYEGDKSPVSCSIFNIESIGFSDFSERRKEVFFSRKMVFLLDNNSFKKPEGIAY